jgi:hypothetical protein
MNIDKDREFFFAREDTIFRIISIAQILSWIMLFIYLISFAMNIRNYLVGTLPSPFGRSDWPIVLVNFVFTPAIGLFYFTILQGIAQGLNLGLDIFYELHTDDDVGEESEQKNQEV